MSGGKNLINRVGHKYGKWTVLKQDLAVNNKKSRKTRWICQCECGTIKSVSASSLQQGSSTSCGCDRKTTAIDISGQRYGKLVAQYRVASDEKGFTQWMCRCDCGNDVIVRLGSLRSGNTMSCGCGHNYAQICDIRGNKYGRLTVLDIAGRAKNRQILWKCKCECGNEIIVNGNVLRRGDAKSCGCFRKEKSIDRFTTHGMTKTRLYIEWASIKERALCKNKPKDNNYTGYGIGMCDDWKNSFISFAEWAVNNGYTDKLTIDRIDNSKGYYPENCRWVDMLTQGNNKTNNHRVTINGETHTISEWCRIKNANKSSVYRRRKRGLPPEEWFKPKIKRI